MELNGETPPSSSGEQSPIHNSIIPLGHAKMPRFQTSQAGRSTETKNVSREQDPPATPTSSTTSEPKPKIDKGKRLIKNNPTPLSSSSSIEDEKREPPKRKDKLVPNSKSNSLESKPKFLPPKNDDDEPAELIEKWVYSCPCCQYWSCSQACFGKHVRTHNSTNAFQCTGCNRGFVFKTSIAEHVTKCRKKFKDAEISTAPKIRTDDASFQSYFKSAMVPGTVKEGFFPSPEEDTVVISLDDDDDDVSIVELSSDSEVDDVEMRPMDPSELLEEEAKIGNLIRFMNELPPSPPGKRVSECSDTEPRLKKRRSASPEVVPPTLKKKLARAPKPKFIPLPRAKEDNRQEVERREKLSTLRQKIQEKLKLLKSTKSNSSYTNPMALERQIDAKRAYLQQIENEHSVSVEANMGLRENVRQSLRRRTEELQNKKEAFEKVLREAQWDLVEMLSIEEKERKEASIKKMQTDVSEINKAIRKVEEEDRILNIEMKQADQKMASTAEQVKTGWAQLAAMEEELNSQNTMSKELERLKDELASMVRSSSIQRRELASLSVAKLHNRWKKNDADLEHNFNHLKLSEPLDEPRPSTSRDAD